jgi:hypothetical protein
MGFNHCYFSSLDNLQREYENVGLEKFVKRYRKYHALTGPSECFRFLEDKQKEYELQSIQVVDEGKETKTT